MTKRGRPKGSLNKKTLEKLVQEKEQEVALEKADAVLTKEELPSAVDDAAMVMAESKTLGKAGIGKAIRESLGKTQKKVLDGPKTKTVADLPRNPSIVEILALVEETKGKQSKIDILKQFTSRNDVKYALKAAFDDRVQFTLPEGIPEGTQIGDPDTPEGAMDIAPERFIRVFKRMQYWVKGGLANSTSKVAKQEEIFLNTLRSLEKSEAEFLLAIKDKTMPFKSVTKEICEDAGFDLTPK
jgi:peptidyl-tRNA hydrolase